MTMQTIFTVACLITSAYSFAPLPNKPSKPTFLSSTATLTTWEATNSDISTMINFMDQKAAFDRSLTGRAPSHLRATPGSTLQSLFPEVPNGRVMFVGNGRNDPIGFAMYALRYYGFEPPLLWLEDIYVDPEKRSGGIGSQMMEEIASIGESHGCSHVSWIVDSRNERGIQFYNQIGALIEGEQGAFFRMKWVPDSWQ